MAAEQCCCGHDAKEAAMLTLEWNALRPGDHVLLHDDRDPKLTLRRGTVAIVQARSGAANDVVLRVDGRVRQVRRHAVHLIPFDESDCWRCATRREATRRAA
jgi:hypothetical protein